MRDGGWLLCMAFMDWLHELMTWGMLQTAGYNALLKIHEAPLLFNPLGRFVLPCSQASCNVCVIPRRWGVFQSLVCTEYRSTLLLGSTLVDTLNILLIDVLSTFSQSAFRFFSSLFYVRLNVTATPSESASGLGYVRVDHHFKTPRCSSVPRFSRRFLWTKPSSISRFYS